MNTAVMPATDASKMSEAEVFNWVAPKPEKGMTVLFYKNGDLNSEPMLATCIKAKGRAIEIMTLVGRVGYGSVLHKDDPRAQTNKDLRLNGLWDFTSESKQAVIFRDQVRSLTDRVERMEAIIADLLGENPSRKK